MIYIGAVMLSCSVILNPDINFCSNVNLSLPFDIRNSCVDATYTQLIPIELSNTVTHQQPTPTSVGAKSTPSITSYNIQPTSTPTSQNQISANYTPSIIVGSGVFSMAFVAGVLTLLKYKNSKPHQEEVPSPPNILLPTPIESDMEIVEAPIIKMPTVSRIYDQDLK